jgi:hypothetical protein
MCVSPVVRNATTRSGDSPDVSPSTRPGSRPRGPCGNGDAAVRKPSLMRPAMRSVGDAAPTCVGDPRASKSAVSNSPGCGTLTRPTAVTRCVGCSVSQPGPVASTTIGELILVLGTSSLLTSTALANNTTSERPEPADEPADKCGSLVTTSSKVTVAWARASDGNGPRCTAATRQAAAAAAPAAQRSAAATTRVRTWCRGRRSRSVVGAIAAPATMSTTAVSSPAVADIDSAIAAVSHAIPAGTSSLSSTGSPAISITGTSATRGVGLTPSPARRAPRISPARCPKPAAAGSRW